MEHFIKNFLEHYGYIGIIITLMGGIIGIPLPDEVILTYVGYAVFKDEMSYVPSLASAFSGAIIHLKGLLSLPIQVPYFGVLRLSH